MSYSSGSGSNKITTSQDAAMSNIQNNQLISYDATIQKWTNRTPVSADVSDLQAYIDARINALTGISSGPGTPTLTLTATAADTMLTVSWATSSPINGVTGWFVGRDGTDSGGYGAYSTTVGTDTQSFQFTALVNGASYTMSVAPVVNGVTGSAITIAKTPVGSPSTGATPLFSASVVNGDTTAILNWSIQNSISGQTGWRVSRDGVDSTGYGAYTTDVATTVNSVTFSQLVNGTNYNLSVAPIVNGSAGSAVTVVGKPASSGTGGSTGTGTAGSGKFARFSVPARGWWSGAAGEAVDYNSPDFGNWRGDTVDALATWINGNNDSNWGNGIGGNTGPGAAFKGLLDISIGGPIDYAAAANGSLDGALTGLLQRLKAARTIGGVEYPTVIRPMHELDGNWFNWSVNSGNLNNFRAVARRWRSIANNTFPNAIWALCFNGDSNNTDVTPAQMWENGVWDAVGADRYNQYPHIGQGNSGYTSWADASNRGSADRPEGAQKWLAFAAARGVPLYFPEYANNGGSDANGGDDPYWVQQWFAWVRANSGTGSGKVFAEMWFNIIGKEDNKWHIYSKNVATRQPNTANAYKALFPF